MYEHKPERCTADSRAAHEGAAAEVEEDEERHAVLPAAHRLAVRQVEDDAGAVTDVAALAEVVEFEDRNQRQDRCGKVFAVSMSQTVKNWCCRLTLWPHSRAIAFGDSPAALTETLWPKWLPVSAQGCFHNSSDNGDTRENLDTGVSLDK